LNRAEPEKRDRMLDLVTRYKLEKLETTDEASALAELYVEKDDGN
jgi:hypothetical protein